MDLRVIGVMDIDDKIRVARVGNMDKDACAVRLRAAREFTGMSQKEFAEQSDQRASAINNSERGLSYPSRKTMRFLYRGYKIDFTFILHGDFSQLPSDVSGPLLDFLAAE